MSPTPQGEQPGPQGFMCSRWMQNKRLVVAMVTTGSQEATLLNTCPLPHLSSDLQLWPEHLKPLCVPSLQIPPDSNIRLNTKSFRAFVPRVRLPLALRVQVEPPKPSGVFFKTSTLLSAWSRTRRPAVGSPVKAGCYRFPFKVKMTEAQTLCLLGPQATQSLTDDLWQSLGILTSPTKCPN